MIPKNQHSSSKEMIKSLSKKEAALEMFTSGFLAHADMMEDQLNQFNEKISKMSEEEIDEMLKETAKNKHEKDEKK